MKKIKRFTLQEMEGRAYRDSAFKMDRIFEETRGSKHESTLLHGEEHEPPFMNEEDGCPGIRCLLCVFAEVDRHPQPEVELGLTCCPSEQRG
jgi:hypothetical protein